MKIGTIFFSILVLQMLSHILGTPIEYLPVGGETTKELETLQLKTSIRKLNEIMLDTTVACLFASPSIEYFLANVILYLICVVVVTLTQGDMNAPAYAQSVFQVPVFVITFYLFFYMLQERELRHFVQEMRITQR